MLRLRSSHLLYPTLWRYYSRNSYKVGLFGDVHFQDKGLDKIEETGQWIIQTMKNQNVDAIVCLGDLLNTREQVSVTALHSCLQFLEQLRTTLQVPIHIVLGNHDMNLKHSHQISSLDVLTMKPLQQHFILHKQIQQVNLDGNLDCVMIPYFENQKQFIQQYFEKEKDWKNTIVFGHLELQGAIHQFHKDNQGNTFVKYISGEDKNKEVIHRPATKKNNTTTQRNQSLTSILSQCKRVFSGHLHHFHTLPKFPQIVYCGSPMQHHFGDSFDEQRGVTIYDAVSDTVSFIQNPKWDCFRILKFTHTFQTREFMEHCKQIRNGKLPNEFQEKHISIQMEHKLLNDPSLSISFERIQQELLELGAIEVKKQSLPFVSLPVQFQKLNPLQQTTTIQQEHLWNSATMLESYLDHVFGAVIPIEWKKVLLEKGKTVMQSITKNTTSLISPGATFEANIKTIVIENFLGIQEAIQMDMDQMSDGIWLLQGTNGSGKSTILEAIIWCLFDETLRSDMKADYVINDTIKKNCLVRIEFENGYAVERFRKYTEESKSVQNASGKDVPIKKGNGFRVFKDGIYLQNYEKGSLGASQKAFQRDILKITFEIFSKSVILGDNLINFVTSKDKTRRELIEEILGMTQVDDLLAEVRKTLKVVYQKKIDSTKDWNMIQTELSKVTSTIQKLESEKQQLEETKQKHLDVATQLKTTTEYTKFNQKKQDIMQWLRSLETKWNVYQQELQTIKVEERRLEDYLAQERDLLQSIQQNESNKEMVLGLETEFNERQKAIAEATLHISSLEQEYAYSLAQLENTTKELERLQALLDKKQCPVCEQDISTHKHDEFETNIQLLIEKQSKLEQSVAILEEQKKQERKWLLDQTTKVNSVTNQLQTARQRLSELKEKEDRLCRIRESVKTSRLLLNTLSVSKWTEAKSFYVIQSETFSDLQKEELEIQKQEYEAVMDIKLVERLLEEKTKQLLDFRAQKAEIEESSTRLSLELSSLEQQLRAYEFWENAFSSHSTKFTAIDTDSIQLKNQSFRTIRQYMLDQSIVEINSILKEYSTFLDQSLDINLDSNLQITEDYGKRSAGQRKRNHLVIFFALFDLVRQRSSFRANFMALDEVFDSLDQRGQLQVLQLLELMTRKVGKVFVVSHSTHLIEGVKKRIIAEMTPKGTQYSISS